MGYFMYQRGGDFMIKKENFDAALNALKSIFVPEKMTVADYIRGKEYPHFSWVDTKTVLESEYLKDALEEIRWTPTFDMNGNISALEFTGEKSGDEDIFFGALAPYVEDGSYIEMIGEDDCIWRWVFEDGHVKEKTPRIEWN